LLALYITEGVFAMTSGKMKGEQGIFLQGIENNSGIDAEN